MIVEGKFPRNLLSRNGAFGEVNLRKALSSVPAGSGITFEYEKLVARRVR